MSKPINRNSRAYVAEQRARREAAVEAARIEAETRNATQAQTIAAEALEKLGEVVRGEGPRVLPSGGVDSAYVQALRLALHAGGVLREKVDVNSKNVTRVEVVHADDAPGTLRKIDGDDEDE